MDGGCPPVAPVSSRSGTGSFWYSGILFFARYSRVQSKTVHCYTMVLYTFWYTVRSSTLYTLVAALFLFLPTQFLLLPVKQGEHCTFSLGVPGI